MQTDRSQHFWSSVQRWMFKIEKRRKRQLTWLTREVSWVAREGVPLWNAELRKMDGGIYFDWGLFPPSQLYLVRRETICGSKQEGKNQKSTSSENMWEIVACWASPLSEMKVALTQKRIRRCESTRHIARLAYIGFYVRL